MLRKTLGRYLRSGLINAEGPRHRLVRRIVNPLFSQSNIRGMMPTFKFKCSELRGIWFERMNQAIVQQDDTKAPKTAVLMDVLDGLNRLSFDIIGLTAFDHAFDALHGIEGKMHPTSWPGEEQVENGTEEPGQRGSYFSPRTSLVAERVVNSFWFGLFRPNSPH
jgi:cytochrome P450